MIHNLKISFTILLITLSMMCYGKSKVKVVNTQCEYQESPIGIDTQQPRFTWALDSDIENTYQVAYRLEIASKPELLVNHQADIWDSGERKGHLSSRTVYQGEKELEAHKIYYWQVTVRDLNNNSFTSDIQTFETAKMKSSDWKAKWITDSYDKELEPAPLFRKEFRVPSKIVSARAYVSGTGYYEIFINGKRVGENFLDPGYTHFDKRILYVTHDITSLVRKGDNTIAAVLGNGFYNCQSRAVWDFEKARWRNRPSLLCELRITYADGTSEVIASDQTWKTNIGAYIYNNIYSGDKYDARREEYGWKLPHFDDTKWKTVQIAAQPAPLLKAQQMPAIRITEELRPIAMNNLGDSIYIFDFGRNIAGVCKLRVKGEAGTTFALQHGELLKENGRLEPGNIDVYYKPIKPNEIFQTDVFTLKGTGKQEEFIPQFTYHGFRYVEVKCSRPVKLSARNLTGLFLHTDLEQVGKFSCSNPLLNKIWEATNQSYRSNLHSIPTDCPQREKNGWTADAHAAIDLALLNFNGITFYEKWMNDFIDNQRPNGNISGIIPSDTWGYGDFPGPVWDAALFIIPNALYNYYGETRCIEHLYPTMERYLNYLKPLEKDGYLTFGLGDWLTYKAETPNEYTSTLFYYQDYKLMAWFASLLGKDATPYREKAETLKNLINKKFFHPESGIYANGTQTAQAIALYMDIVPDDKKELVAKQLHKVVEENNYFLNFGLLGSKTVPAMLAKYGYVEDAYKMITKTEAPSWGYWIETKGYTTLAETWLLSPEFRDASLNHVFMGDVSAWMYNYLAGINYDSNQPGFEHIIIQPCFVKELNWVRGSYRSIKGLISSEWKRENDKIKLTVTIPANTTATIHADKSYDVGSGVHKYTIPIN